VLGGRRRLTKEQRKALWMCALNNTMMVYHSNDNDNNNMTMQAQLT